MERKRKNIQQWQELPIIFDLPLASRLVGLGAERLRQLCREGSFPAKKIGNSWRVDREEFITWWNNQQKR